MLDSPDRPAPPVNTVRKTLPVNQEYEDRAKACIRKAMREHGVTVEELAQRLSCLGIEITRGALANKISRGGFSAAFLLQCLDVLERHVVPRETVLGG